MTRKAIKDTFLDTVNSQIHGAFVLSVVVLIAVCVASNSLSEQYEKEVQLVSSSYDVIEAVSSFSLSVTTAESSARGYCTTNIDEYLAPYEVETLRIEPLLNDIRLLTKGKESQQQRVQTLQGVTSERMKILAGTLSKCKQGISIKQVIQKIGAKPRVLSETIAKLTREIKEEELTILESSKAALESSRRVSQRMVAGMQVLAAFILFTFYLLAVANLAKSKERDIDEILRPYRR